MERSELKFRLWLNGKMLTDKDDGFYDYTMTLDSELLNEDNIEHRSFAVEGEYVIMQFTGLKDKNGKEIYEGDILRRTSPCPSGHRDEVEKVTLENYFGFWGYWESEGYGKVEEEVIGNIYENPELMEEGEDGEN